MAKGKIILICQSGGEFVTQDDGTMSYEGGEANAVNVNQESLFDDLKLKLAEMSNLNQNTVSIKYFLPGNRRTLITLRNDKDLKRLIGFHGNSVTADIFINGEKGFDHSATEVQAIQDNGVKLAETITHTSAPSAVPNPVGRKVKHASSHTKAAGDKSNPPVGSTSATEKTGNSSSSSETSSDSLASFEDGGEYDDSDYKPGSVARRRNGFDMDSSPADTVKKRRRTASWIVGEHGPTIVSVGDNDGDRRRRKRTSNLDLLIDINLDTDDDGSPSNVASGDDDLPEKLIASWKDCITGVGQDFKSVKEFRETLQKYAVAHRFVYKLKKNETNRVSGVCVEEGCSWSIYAAWVPEFQTFRIKKFDTSHTCGGESWKNAHPAKSLLVSLIKNKLMESPHHKPKEIAKIISQDFGIHLKSAQIRRGLENAREQLQGSYKESYNRLPWFCEKLVETNPGSFVKLICNDEKRLQSLFVSFNSCIQNFQKGCRPVLFLNSTSLRSKYHETLLTATAIDGDDEFFPVAFCIVDNENEGSWHWFLDQLESAISTSVPLTLVSDMEKGLKKSVQEVFEKAYHGYSMYHLLESFKKNLKGPFHGEGRGVLPGKFLDAAHAVRLSNFKKFTEQIKQISPSAYDWLIQIGAEHWTNVSFKGELYNYILENVGEPYTKLMDEIRETTIMQKIEALIQMMNELIDSRRTESSYWTTKLTPSREKRIQEEAFKGHGLRVFISSDILFEVHDDSTHVVNIDKWECTCLEWRQNGLPCRHAIAALISSGKSFYDYCSKPFTVESYRSTYSESINPIPGLGAHAAKDEADAGDVQVLPPAPRSPDKEKKEETKEEDLDKRTVTCSKCKELGHNKASCKATTPTLAPTPTPTPTPTPSSTSTPPPTTPTPTPTATATTTTTTTPTPDV